MNDDRVLFEKRIETLRKLDPTSSAYERLYVLTMIMSAMYDWGVIDPMIKEVQV
jgi:hypothetical protein